MTAANNRAPQDAALPTHATPGGFAEETLRAATSDTGRSICAWCGSRFRPRHDGGHAQRFCQSACRRALDAAGRSWTAAALASGMLTVDALQSGPATTRALLPTAVSRPAEVGLDEPGKPASRAPAEPPDAAAELLRELLAVESEGWHALAEAMPEKLFDKLKRWHTGHREPAAERAGAR